MTQQRKTKAHRLVEKLNNPWSQIATIPEPFPIDYARLEQHPITWNLWMEGYQATCEHARARFLGSYLALSYDEAVNMYLDEHLPDPNSRSQWRKNANGQWSDWGCRIFDNEKDARAFCG